MSSVAAEAVSSTDDDRVQTASRIANQIFQQQPDWLTFFREVLGVDGLVRKLFPSAAEFAEFEKTEAYAEIQQMVNKLREHARSNSEQEEPTRVITVRIPRSLHQALQAEAHDRRTSLNQLCISKLLQVIDEQMQVLGEAVPRSIRKPR